MKVSKLLYKEELKQLENLAIPLKPDVNKDLNDFTVNDLSNMFFVFGEKIYCKGTYSISEEVLKILNNRAIKLEK